MKGTGGGGGNRLWDKIPLGQHAGVFFLSKEEFVVSCETPTEA